MLKYYIFLLCVIFVNTTVALVITNTKKLASHEITFAKGLIYTSAVCQSSDRPYAIHNVFAESFTQSSKISSVCSQDKNDDLTCSDSLLATRTSRNHKNLPNKFLTSIGPLFPSGVIICGTISTEYFTDLDGEKDLTTNWKELPLLSILSVHLKRGQVNGGQPLLPAELYTGREFLFQCDSVDYYFHQNKSILIRFKNGSVILAEHEASNVDMYKDHAKGSHTKEFALGLTTDMEAIICTANHRDSTAWSSIYTIRVEEQRAPKFEEDRRNFVFAPFEKTPFLLCRAKGVPHPIMNFYRNGKKIVDAAALNWLFKNGEEHVYLNFFTLSREDVGEYLCRAESSAGSKEIPYTIKIEDPTSLTKGGIAGISIGILAIVCIFVLLLAWILLRKQNRLTDAEINEFFKGNPDALKDGKNPNNFDHIPYESCHEIPKGRFEVAMSQVLGSGAFGMVVRGKVGGVDVAVKTVKPYSDKSYLKSLLSELKILAYLGFNDNIVSLVGAFTQDLKRGTVFVFVEYCPLGDLENYLKSHRKFFLNSSDRNRLYDNVQTQPLCYQDLVRWSIQIANALEYISSQKVIHGDMACRNVLLSRRDCAKISDFGLSRKLYAYTNYVKKNQEPLPWRWMAVESLREMEFSTESDIWAYGVTLWEIFSLADIPFPGLSWTIEFVDELERGLRNSQPVFASEKIYGFMLRCWDNQPGGRPSFIRAIEFFEKIFSELSYKDQKMSKLEDVNSDGNYKNFGFNEA